MATQNVNLPEHQSRFIRERVESGRYQNASEVVRAGLRLLEQLEEEDQARLENLRRLTHEGLAELDRGKYTTYTLETLDAFFDELDRADGLL